MGGTLKFTDTIKISLLDPNLIKIKDHYEGAFKPASTEQTHPSGMGTIPGTVGGTVPTAAQAPIGDTQQPGTGLLVRIAATHSGIITGNNGFYLPDRMKKGTSSFTDNFQKPILTHHEDKQDPIGRVVESHYIDTSGAVIEQYQDMVVKNLAGKQVGVISDVLINDFCSGKMPYGMAVDTIRTIFQDSLLNDPVYNGLGHIQLVANITDHEAIKKLLDGRFLTGSVGASTNSASCSVCKQDWTEVGKCEHKPGGIYDSQKCFIIAGDLSYSEYSFVNKPADRHSKVLQLNYNGITDNIEYEDKYSGRIYEVQLGFPQFDDSITTKEEEVMKTEPKGTVEIKDSATKKSDEETIEEDSKKVVADSSKDKKEVTDEKKTEIEDNSIKETLDQFIVKVLEDSEEKIDLSDEDDQKLYDALWEEVLAVVNDGEIVIEAELLKDAKLSTEARNKLPKSSFCGPSRSFPVPDCAHVTAARRLVGRAKVGDSTKSSILACVNRKSKAMGCGSSISTKDSVQTKDDLNHSRVLRMVLNVLDEDIYFSDEPVLGDEDKKALQNIVKRMALLVGKDSFTEAALTEEVIVKDVTASEKSLLDEVAKHEGTIGDLRDRLEANRRENAELYQDYADLQDSLVKTNESLRTEKEKRMSTLRALRDGKVEEHDFAEIKDSELQSEIDQALKTIDMNKITDKLGDGLSRNPEGDVDDPTQIHNSVNSDPKKWKVEDLQAINERYQQLLFGSGEIVAEQYRKQMQREGKLPQENENIQGGSN